MTYDELVDYCKEASQTISELDYKNRILEKENQKLKKQLDKYENPEDMTLFAMWCTEKVKGENERLSEQLELLTSKLDEYDLIVDERNQLKKQLEVGEEQYNDLVEEKESLQEQLSSNILQLEEYKEQVNKGLYNSCLPYTTGYNKAIKDKEIQQKEFIRWLEDEIKLQEEINDKLLATGFEEVLQKYKEIIGVEDENKRN